MSAGDSPAAILGPLQEQMAQMQSALLQRVDRLEAAMTKRTPKRRHTTDLERSAVNFGARSAMATPRRPAPGSEVEDVVFDLDEGRPALPHASPEAFAQPQVVQSAGEASLGSAGQDIAEVASVYQVPSSAASHHKSEGVVETVKTGGGRRRKAPRIMEMQSVIGLGLDSGGNAYLRRQARRILHFKGRMVDFIVGAVIMINSICIGLEIQYSLEGQPSSFLASLEHLFLVIFLVDLIIRILANERRYLSSGWFFLEAGLVILGILLNWIISPILAATSGNSASSTLESFLILRMMRLFRFVRALRLLEAFGELWRLCNGLIHSVHTVMYALFLLLATTYVFGCFAVEVITQSELLQENEATRLIVEKRFGSLWRSSLTLLSFANADSLAAVYEPLIEQNPWLAPFFAVVWLVITVSLMNLVTAVIVDNAITQSREDIETKRAETRKTVKALQPQIEKLFIELDRDKDDMLSIDEVDLEFITMPEALRYVIDEEKLRDLFEFLDDDGSGSVDKEEFIEGVASLALQNVPIETTQILHLLRNQRDAIADIQSKL